MPRKETLSTDPSLELADRHHGAAFGFSRARRRLFAFSARSSHARVAMRGDDVVESSPGAPQSSYPDCRSVSSRRAAISFFTSVLGSGRSTGKWRALLVMV